MPSRRVLKVAEAVREVVSMAILAELKDPRVRDVTVTYVEVSADLRHAKIHVSVMGDEAKQQLSLRGLQSAAGFLQARCATRIDSRYTPRIRFVLDQGVKKSIEISEILDRVLPRDSVPGETADQPAAGTTGETEPETECETDGQSVGEAGPEQAGEGRDSGEAQVGPFPSEIPDRTDGPPTEPSHPPPE